MSSLLRFDKVLGRKSCVNTSKSSKNYWMIAFGRGLSYFLFVTSNVVAKKIFLIFPFSRFCLMLFFFSSFRSWLIGSGCFVGGFFLFRSGTSAPVGSLSSVVPAAVCNPLKTSLQRVNQVKKRRQKKRQRRRLCSSKRSGGRGRGKKLWLPKAAVWKCICEGSRRVGGSRSGRFPSCSWLSVLFNKKKQDEEERSRRRAERKS